MLVNDPTINAASHDPLLALVAEVAGRSAGATELATGVYEIGHFGGAGFPGSGYYGMFDDNKPSLSIDEYGVCDSYEQILANCPELSDPNRRFVIILTRIVAKDEPAAGGWRWHKWGPYIGEHEPTCEYIHDEPEIAQVFVYHIYEQKP